MEEQKRKVGLSVAEKITMKLWLILALYFKVLPVASSGLVLICNIFEETFLPSSCLLASLLSWDLKLLTSHIYFHLDDSKLWKQYQSLSQVMMGQICDLETVEPRGIPWWGNTQKRTRDVLRKATPSYWVLN